MLAPRAYSLLGGTNSNEGAIAEANSLPPAQDYPVINATTPFASKEGIYLNNDLYLYIFSFLGRRELAISERVCRTWFKYIDLSGQWRRQCQVLLGIHPMIDPKPNDSNDPATYLPSCPFYRRSLQLMSSRIFDGNFHEQYFISPSLRIRANIGSVPPIPEKISLKRWNEPDFYNPLTATIGTKYVWIFFPSYVETIIPGDSLYYLNKEDDPEDPKAPRICRRDPDLGEVLVAGLGFRTKSENKVLRVPMTFYNIMRLCAPDMPENTIWGPLEDYVDTRMPSEWICMRGDVIGRGLSFPDQENLANENGASISDATHRLFLTFLRKARPKTTIFSETNQWIYARTSTSLHYADRLVTQCEVGFRSKTQVSVRDSLIPSQENIGVAVELSNRNAETIA